MSPTTKNLLSEPMSAANESNQDFHTPRWWVAALWALISPPTAYLYTGRPRWAGVGFAGIFAWIVFCIAAGFAARVAGVGVVLLVGSIYSALPIIFALMARQRGETIKSVSLRSYIASLAVWLALLAFVGTTAARTIGLRVYKIPADSMENTLLPGDFVLVDSRAFDRQAPTRGDIVTHTDRRGRDATLVKRIAGLPGDTVQLKYKLLYVNGKLVNPPRTATYQDANRIFPAEMSPRDNHGPVVVPTESYFVLGDNRDKSLDSRFWGSIPRSSISGRVRLVLFSLEGMVFRPDRLRLEPL